MKPQQITLESVMREYYGADADRRRAALRVFKSALDGEAGPTAEPPRTLATKKEVAEYFKRSQRWVDLQADAGRLPRLRTPGRRRGVRFRWPDVHALEESMLVEVEE